MTEQEPKSEFCGNCHFFNDSFPTYCFRRSGGIVHDDGKIEYGPSFYVSDTYWCKYHKPCTVRKEEE